MNYYIKGDPARAEQIKTAFEAKGYDISWPEGCADPDVINIGVERNDAKYVVAETSEYIKDIIKTHPDYKELELPVQPNFKVGDWVVSIRDTSLTYRILEPNVTNEYNEQGELDYKFEIYSNGIYQQTWFITSNKMDEWGRLWTIADAKDGDVLANDAGCIFINAGFEKDDKVTLDCYCYVSVQGDFYEEDHKTGSWLYASHIHPATKKQRDLLFAKMKEAGYEWDADKKELHKIQSHYDIANFHAGMPVMVRDCDEHKWLYTIFGIYNKDNPLYPFVVVNMRGYKQCIPYNYDTKHLLGTTDPCGEEYINW